MGAGTPNNGAPPKKRSKKLRNIVLGLVALVVLIIIITTTSSGSSKKAPTADPAPSSSVAAAAPPATSAPTTAAPTTPPSTTVPVTYKVTSNGKIGTISTLAMQQGGIQQKQANGAPSPWTETIQVDKALFGGGVGAVGLTAQAGQGASTITCEIDVPGKAPITNTSTGQFAVVSCNGS